MIKWILEALRFTGVFGLHIGGGGGGGGTTESTTYTSNVPEYAKPQFLDLVGKAQALSEAPYQAYTGERVAQFSPLQQQAFQQAGQQQVAPQTGLASGLAGLASGAALSAGTYNPAQFQAGRFGNMQAAQYMSPFIGEALAPQLRELTRQSDIQGTQQQAQAVQRGAFGGSRDAIMRAERERNLMQQQGDVLSKGYQTAYEQAAAQFNQDMARRMEAQRMAEQSRQFGADVGLRGASTALQGAQTLGQLGQQQFGQEMDITKLQTELGGQQRQAVQDILSQQYADFQRQRDYPYQQIGFLSDILRGSGGSTRSVYPGPSPVSQLSGLGTAAYGLSGMMKKGGEVKRPAGLADLAVSKIK